MRVKLVDSEKKKHKFPMGFSFWYLFFGPLYTLIRGKIIYSILVIIYYIVMIPKPIFISLIEKIIHDENVVNVLSYPHNNFDIFTILVLILIPHIILCIYIDNYFVKLAVNKKNMLPASDVDLEKLAKVSKKYKDLPIDSSFIEGLVIVKPDDKEKITKSNKSVIALDSDNLLTDIQKHKKDRLDEAKQRQLDLVYSKYHLGLISENELIEAKEKIINEKN
ncbi:MAG: hypothetical protein J1F32_03300 [Erysipelotrichales bacterium]|nr:hypothetical protein [Erysipelotrichales bacterium]